MDRLAVILACVGVGLFGLTAGQVRTWASDVSLWKHAAAVNTTSPRPAFNLGLAYRQVGLTEHAAIWFMAAVERSKGTPAEPEYRARVSIQFAVLEAYGVFLCDSPSVRPYC